MNSKNISLSFLKSVKKTIFKSNSINIFHKKLHSMRIGFLSQNIPFSHNIYNLCIENLDECKDIKELRHTCLTNANQLINLIKSKTILVSIFEKIKNNSLILAIGKNSNNNMKKIKKKFKLFDEKSSLNKIDVAFIDINAITKKGLVVNTQIKEIVKKLNKLKIPIYACSSIFNFDKEKYNKNNILKENSIKGIISEIGIYSHQDFIHAIEKEYPSLFEFF